MDNQFYNSKALRKGRFSISGGVYFITATTHKRQKIFNKFLIAQAAIKAFTHPQVIKESEVLCWVLMPDHAHWLIQLGEGEVLSKLMARIKAASTRNIRQLQDTYPIWQTGFYDHALRKEEDILQVSRYIVANPLRAGLVESVKEYPFWDAKWL